MFYVPSPPRVVDQNVAHQLRGHGEEVSTILPTNTLRARKANIGLVNQRRGLERVALALALHVAMRDASYLVVDQRGQAIEGRTVSLPPFDQQARQIIRGKRIHPAQILTSLVPANFSLSQCVSDLFEKLNFVGLDEHFQLDFSLTGFGA
jgi:hypothetical protein